MAGLSFAVVTVFPPSNAVFRHHLLERAGIDLSQATAEQSLDMWESGEEIWHVSRPLYLLQVLR